MGVSPLFLGQDKGRGQTLYVWGGGGNDDAGIAEEEEDALKEKPYVVSSHNLELLNNAIMIAFPHPSYK